MGVGAFGLARRMLVHFRKPVQSKAAVDGRSWRQSALKTFSHTVTKLAAVEQLTEEWQALAEQSQTLPIKSYN